jgi:hypothetical protein
MSWNQTLPGALYIFPNQTPFLELCRPSLLKSQPWTWCLNARKRQQRTKAVHVQDAPPNKEGTGIALATFVTEAAKERTASSPAAAITVSQTLSKWRPRGRLSSPPLPD